VTTERTKASKECTLAAGGFLHGLFASCKLQKAISLFFDRLATRVNLSRKKLGFSDKLHLAIALTLLTGANAIADGISPIPEPSWADVNATEVILGRRLFNSPLLSGDNKVSCASCHNLEKGGDDGRQVAVGVDGRQGSLNTPTVLNSSLNRFLFWDGRAESLEEQIAGPLHGYLEMDSSWDKVVAKLSADEVFALLFDRVYEDGITADNVTRAIAAFEATLLTPNSPFDRYVEGDSYALSVEAARGQNHFMELGCVACHQGTNLGGNLFQYFGVVTNYIEERGNIQTSDYGRYNVTGDERDRYKFRVPGLRNVARTAPYFHDGSIATLKEAVEIEAYYQLGRSLSEAQINELEAFLISLNGELPEGDR